MNKQEFSKFAAALKSIYPKEGLLPDKMSAELWYKLLGDLDYTLAEAVLIKWTSEHKWPPTIAEIREMAAEITYGSIPDWSESWDMAMKAIHRYGSWDADAAFREMDDLTAETVRRLGYVNLCLSENLSVDRASYRQIYNTLAERKKTDRQIAPSVVNLIEQIRNPRLEG